MLPDLQISYGKAVQNVRKQLLTEAVSEIERSKAMYKRMSGLLQECRALSVCEKMDPKQLLFREDGKQPFAQLFLKNGGRLEIAPALQGNFAPFFSGLKLRRILETNLGSNFTVQEYTYDQWRVWAKEGTSQEARIDAVCKFLQNVPKLKERENQAREAFAQTQTEYLALKKRIRVLKEVNSLPLERLSYLEEVSLAKRSPEAVEEVEKRFEQLAFKKVVANSDVVTLAPKSLKELQDILGSKEENSVPSPSVGKRAKRWWRNLFGSEPRDDAYAACQ